MNYKIKKIEETFYSEIRELEGGHSTRGSGVYEKRTITRYKVGNKVFNTLYQAKKYKKNKDETNNSRK